MKKIFVLIVVLVTVFAFTISASAGGNGPAGGVGPGDGTGPIGGLGTNDGNGAGGNGSGIGPGDGTGPVGGLGPIGVNSPCGSDCGYGPLGGNGSAGSVSGNGLGQKGASGIFDMSGMIAAIGTSTVTINVLHGNKQVQLYIGTQVSVTVTSQTGYLYTDGKTATTIGFADLKVGQQVSVHGTLADSVWTASRITVGASLDCLP